jgi:23S rRNA pseudouridine2605 synthase
MPTERLQKIIARAGITSRRKAEGLITAGRIAVNGEIVRELGSTADPRSDLITFDGRALFEEERRYLLINKPKRMLCALRDRFERPLIIDLLGDDVRERVFPAGRLDYDSEGLVLLTNDGDLMEAITRPGRGVAKVYEVMVEGEPSETDLQRLAGGVFLEAQPEWRPVGWEEESAEQKESRADDRSEGQTDDLTDDLTDGQFTLPCTIERLEAGTTSRFRVTLHEGKKNQIRRMFALIDAPVVRLVRVALGELKIDDLQAGEYRSLSAREVESLLREVAKKEAGKAGGSGEAGKTGEARKAGKTSP